MSSLRVPHLLVTAGVALAAAQAGAFFVLGCPPPPIVPLDGPDAAPGPQDGSAPRADGPERPFRAPDDSEPPLTACGRACEALRRLGCPEGDPADGGLPCADVCDRAEASGKFSLRPDCVADAGTVIEVRACATVRCAVADAGVSP